jgi:hypothetical protein
MTVVNSAKRVESSQLHSRISPGKGLGGDIATFILATLWFLEVQVVGRLFVIELLFLLITLSVVLSKTRRQKLPPFIKQVVILAAFWLIAQIATDVYRGTPFEDYARGWAKIFFFTSNVVAIWHVTAMKERRILLFIAGYYIGELLGLIWFPNVYYEGGRWWKFGFASPVTTLMTLASLKARSKLLSVIVLIGLSAFNLLLDFRSLAGACVAAAILTSYAGLAPGSQAARRAGWSRATLFLKRLSWTALAAIVVTAFLRLYRSAETIELGAVVGEGSRYGVERNPLYGRMEALVGLKAATDSPLIGHGSWAKNIEYALLAQSIAIDVGKQTGPVVEDLIPTHSYLIGGWVEAGIVGAIFWLFVFVHGVKALRKSLRVIPNLVPIVSFMLINFLWAVLFSPFGAQARITAAFNIVLVGLIFAKSGLAKR